MKKLAKLLSLGLAAAMALTTTVLAAPVPEAKTTIVSESYVAGFGNMTDKFIITSNIDLSNVTVEDIVLEKALVHPYIGTDDVEDFCVYRSPDMKLTINGKDGKALLSFAYDDLTYHNPDVDKFSEGQTGGGIGLKYRLYAPDTAGSGALPIIVHLHGNGQQGDDNLLPLLADNSGVALVTDVVQKGHPCYALVPQCPADSRWTKEAVGEVLDVVNKLVTEGKVDAKRIYLTGHSMGAYGTFQAIADYPGVFAAAVPFAGGCDYTAEIAKAVADSGVAIWIVHAADDFIVKVDTSRDAYKTLKDAGADVYYTELDASLNYNHGSNIKMAENLFPDDGHDDLYTWMFKQTLAGEPDTPSVEPVAPSTGETGTYVVVGGDSLWKIASKLLGSGSRWVEIYEANAAAIRDPNRIYVGQILVIPAK